MKYIVIHLEKTIQPKKVYNHINEIWSIDLADMIDYKTSKKKIIHIYLSYLITFQNICGLKPLRNKNSQTITNEFSNFLTTSRRRALKEKSDRGAEFYNSFF